MFGTKKKYEKDLSNMKKKKNMEWQYFDMVEQLIKALIELSVFMLLEQYRCWWLFIGEWVVG